MYSDYKKECPDCTLSEEQLKHHIRTEKSQLQTGDADDKSGKVVLQPVDYFEQVVKKSNGHAKRNILAEQDRIAAAIPVKKPKASTPVSKPLSGPPTKAQMLHTQIIPDRRDERELLFNPGGAKRVSSAQSGFG